MSKQINRSNLVRDIISAAKIYKARLVGKSFLYVFDNRAIEVSYRARDFLHMTGVEYKGHAEQFFKDATSGKLTEKQISFSKRHPYSLCRKKVSYLGKFCSIIDSDLIILEEVSTNTYVYKFSITDLSFTVCLSEDKNKNGEIVSDHYIVRSLRVEDSFNRSKNAYIVNFIFSKDNGKRRYDCITFASEGLSIDMLPDDIKLYIAPREEIET